MLNVEYHCFETFVGKYVEVSVRATHVILFWRVIGWSCGLVCGPVGGLEGVPL